MIKIDRVNNRAINKIKVTPKHLLGRCCCATVVGKMFSLADKDTKKANGTSHKHIVKKARIYNAKRIN
jgi:hypothetical protein